MSCNNSLFGDSGSYIKFYGGDAIAVEGSTTVEKFILNDVRIPYKQLLKSKVILKTGQVNYLLNHLGLGDNATFLFIKATYNKLSVNAEDNYLTWNYFDDFSRVYSIGEMMILTGNPTNRIKQIYITNPSTKYPVILDVMVGVVDEEYSFYTDSINQVGLSFTNLNINSIETHIPDDSIVIWDNNVPRSALAYIILENIASISRIGKLLIIEDVSIGRIFLDFDTEYDSRQVNSIINYVLENTGVIIQNLSPLADTSSPIIYFNATASDTLGWTISGYGLTYSPVDTSMSLTFSTYLSIGTYSAITKSMISNYVIDSVVDNRDGDIVITDDNIILYDYLNIVSSSIISTGTYSLYFDITDIAGNSIDSNVIFNIYVI